MLLAVDKQMIASSDEAFIVVNNRHNSTLKEFISCIVRSKKATKLSQLALSTEIDFLHEGIPVTSLDAFMERLANPVTNTFIHSTISYGEEISATVLATKTRDASLFGPRLQRVHQEVGRYLADRLLDEFGVIGGLVEETPIAHVQNKNVVGFAGTSDLLILPLMRGGDPMSRGVHDRFPSAPIIHIWDEMNEGILFRALSSVGNVIIVDSVVNEGRSVRKVIKQLQKLAGEMKEKQTIYVLTAVIQEEASLKLPLEFPRVRFLTLRVSKNKYTGIGGTDTGNRLYCTT